MKIIVYKKWASSGLASIGPYYYEGWFLFGFIPLWIREEKKSVEPAKRFGKVSSYTKTQCLLSQVGRAEI